jgi:hypothetical protein
MNNQSADPAAVRNAVLNEFFGLLGIAEDHPLHAASTRLLGPVIGRFAAVMAEFDANVAQLGLPAAIRGLLSRFVDGVTAIGVDQTPAAGPLLLVSNHPGAYDVFASLAQLTRSDIRVVISEISIVRHLPAAYPHFILTGDTDHSRMAAARAVVRQLQAGGVVFIFPGRLVDPDPAFMPGADSGLPRWSPSLELFLRRVPETRVVPIVASGVLSPAWLRSPVTWLRQDPVDRQKVAEVCQVAQQLLWPGSLHFHPLITFGPPLLAADLLRPDAPVRPLQAIVEHQRTLLLLHQYLRTAGLAP